MKPSMLAFVLVVGTVAACGSGGGGGGVGTVHPDTRYGANQPVPSTVNCTDFCTRLADCGTTLCDEDTMTMNYSPLSPLLATECESSVCNQSELSQLSTTSWQCYFQSSCRQVFGQNVCHVSNAKYSCN
jgi:hypothetical protein